MSNIEIARRAELSAWRHMSLGTWAGPQDPSIYGSVTIRMDAALGYLRQFRAATGRHLTVSHMLAKVAGVALEHFPDLNALIRWGRIHLREDVSVFFQVAVEDETTGAVDLSGIKVSGTNKMTLTQIIDAFEHRIERTRVQRDTGMDKSKGRIHRIPTLLVRPLLSLLGLLSYTLNLDLRWAGIPKDPFGALMVSNIGSLGLETAYPPLVPFSRAPIVIAMGKVEERAFVEDGQVVVASAMTLYATLDHRIIDGVHAARLVRLVKDWLEQPFEHFGPVATIASEPAAAVASSADTAN